MATALVGPATAHAQQVDCAAYARTYADAHVSLVQTDLEIVDGAMAGAVAGGAWEGPGGARRGAVLGGALGVLDTLGNTPAGWRGLYDLAYRMCRNRHSPVTHRAATLGDPSHRPALRPSFGLEPPLPPAPLAPRKPDTRD
ncbi:MAG: hypothetical protein Tsb0019_04910 [Roseibium sp.]